MKIDIISGFLGAGKTTLIQKLIDEELYKEKIAIIENEYGEVAIDGTILSSGEIEVKEITSGCICCSITGDFKESIKEIVEKYKPERIIIEPSGVAKFSEVLSSIKSSNLNSVNINMKITLVDASNYKYYLDNFGEFYKNQLESAELIILNRTEALKTEEVDEICNSIKSIKSTLKIITTPLEKMTAKRIMEVAKMQKENLTHEMHKVFENIGIETTKRFNKYKLNKLLNDLDRTDVYGEVLRAKGIVPIEDGKWIQFDYVPKNVDIKDFKSDYTGRICVIGKNLNKNNLKELFLKERRK